MPRKKKEETKADLVVLSLFRYGQEDDVPVLQSKYRIQEDKDISEDPIDLFEAFIRYAYSLDLWYGDFEFLTCKIGNNRTKRYDLVTHEADNDILYDQYDAYEWEFLHTGYED